MLRDPSNIEIPRKPVKCRKSWVRKPLNLGFLNVNMDDSFLGSSGPGGIGGLIRDLESRVLVQFCKEVRVDSAVHTEVLVLREGLLVAMALCWASLHYFMFESDSLSVVTWVIVSSLASWRFHNMFRECCTIFGICINWLISCNDVADALARLGSDGINFIEFL